MSGRLLLKGVHAVGTRAGSIAKDRAVAVENGRIERIGPAAEGASDGAEVVEARGKYLVPGYWDMHVHPFNDKTPENACAMMSAYGIMGMRHMSGSPELLRARREDRLPLGEYAPELLAMPGEILTRANAASPEAAREEVRKQKADGADFIKTIDVGVDTFFAAQEEATREGLPYLGHLSPGVDAAAAARAGMRSIEHLGPADLMLVSCSTEEAGMRQPGRERHPRTHPNSRLLRWRKCSKWWSRARRWDACCGIRMRWGRRSGWSTRLARKSVARWRRFALRAAHGRCQR